MTWIEFAILVCGIAAIGFLTAALFRMANKLEALSVNDDAKDARIAALEDRVALLEVPEVVHRAMKQHILAQSLLDRTEGRA